MLRKSIFGHMQNKGHIIWIMTLREGINPRQFDMLYTAISFGFLPEELFCP